MYFLGFVFTPDIPPASDDNIIIIKWNKVLTVKAPLSLIKDIKVTTAKY